jgi:hypothetical protein
MDRKLVIGMVSAHACIRILKYAIALRAEGHTVILLTSDRETHGHFNYDFIVRYNNGDQFISALRSLSSTVDLWHVHNEPDSLVPVVRQTCPQSIIIYDIHDPNHLRGELYASQDEINSMEMANAYIHVSDKCLELTNQKFPNTKPSIVIHSYVNRMFMVESTRLPQEPCWNSIVYEGGLMSEPPQKAPSGEVTINLRYLPAIFSSLISQKFHVHIHPAADQNYTVYFGVGAFVSPATTYPNMLVSLRPHGFGFVGAAYKSPLMDAAMPNKLFEYMSQGVIPIVYNADTAARYVTENRCGYAIEDIRDTRSKLIDYKQTRKNVLDLRRTMFFETQTNKIVDFYNQVLETTKKEV